MLKLIQPETTQATCLRWKREGRIAFVPTMGCLHEGHLSLVRLARSACERVVVSLFVNPLQFGPTEDLAQYPRPFEEDCRLLESLEVDLLFHPSVEHLYPPGFDTKIRAGSLGTHLCGGSRPGHFDGVLTVCLKLFHLVQPDIAVFGEKDFQQLTLVRHMVSDLALPLSIVGAPIVRELDGLALSSRNRFLTPQLRAIAPTLYRAISACHTFETVGELTNRVRDQLSQFTIDYVSVCDEDTLTPLPDATRLDAIPKPRLFVAGKLGQTRLIDNIAIGHA